MREPDTTAETGLLNDALAYLARGWSIIPVKTGTKKPRLRSWKPFQQAPPLEKMVRSWFGSDADVGIAVVLGAVSGNLICRDFDEMAAYQKWATQFPALADALPTVQTGRGRHVYFTADPAEIRAASQSDSETIKFADGELRGGSCYCVLPPSIHPSGEPYRWLIGLPQKLPRIRRLGEAGFLDAFPAASDGATESNREDGERQREQRNTEPTEAIGGCVEAAAQTFFSAITTDIELNPEIEQAILGSLPTGPGHRNRQVFELCRALKAIPTLADAPGNDLESYVRCWHKLALPVIETQAFEETWIDFLKGWQRVKFAKGTEPMARIMANALAMTPPPEAERYDQETVRQLAALCRELQRAVGDGPFYLSARTAGRVLSVHHVTANRWLFLLEQDGLLRVIEKGGPQTRKATRFRYCGQL